METDCEQIARINLVHYPVTVLGPGSRVGIWFQGCSLACEGCIAVHTWDKNGGYSMNIDSLIKDVISLESDITISGGEPFEQPEALYWLVKELKSHNREILLYSGYRFEYLSKKFSYILEYIDVVIDGAFQQKQPTMLSYKGSENQQIYILSVNKSTINKYQSWSKKLVKELQLVQQSDNCYILGIPEIKDSRRLVNAKI